MHTALRRAVAVLLLTASTFGAQAEDASSACPALPTDGSQLIWAGMQTGTLLLCRAIDGEGREAFAIVVSRESPFKPQRSLREETGRFQGGNIWWYRGEIAGKPQEVVRETLLEVDRERVAHVVIRSENAERLKRYQRVVEQLSFADAGLARR